MIMSQFLYDPDTDTWTAMSTTNGDGAPSGRVLHTAVWTGTENIVCGGADLGSPIPTLASTPAPDLGRYDPGTDSWIVEALPPGKERSGHTAVWTGTGMIIWGSDTDPESDGGQLNDGAIWTYALKLHDYYVKR